MEIEILRERENRTLSRREIEFRVDHSGNTTPSRADVRAKISAMFNADVESVIIKEMHTCFGAGITGGEARIYSSPEQARRVELDYVIRRHEPKEEAR